MREALKGSFEELLNTNSARIRRTMGVYNTPEIEEISPFSGVRMEPKPRWPRSEQPVIGLTLDLALNPNRELVRAGSRGPSRRPDEGVSLHGCAGPRMAREPGLADGSAVLAQARLGAVGRTGGLKPAGEPLLTVLLRGRVFPAPLPIHLADDVDEAPSTWPIKDDLVCRRQELLRESL